MKGGSNKEQWTEERKRRHGEAVRLGYQKKKLEGTSKKREPRSSETKEKISLAHRGKKLTEQTKINIEEGRRKYLEKFYSSPELREEHSRKVKEGKTNTDYTQVFNPEVRQKMSESAKARVARIGPPASPIKLGQKLTKEHKEKISLGLKNRNYTEIYSESWRRATSERLKKRHLENPRERAEIGKRNKEAYWNSPEQQKKLSEAQVREWQKEDVREKRIVGAKKALNTLEIKQKIQEGRRKYYSNNPHKRRLHFLSSHVETKPERLIREYLEDKFISFEQEFELKWKYFDFKIDNYLLEVHGSYWHKDPRFFRYSTEEMLSGVRENDSFKAKLAVGEGYKYRVIWEEEIKNNDFTILDKIIQEIQR